MRSSSSATMETAFGSGRRPADVVSVASAAHGAAARLGDRPAHATPGIAARSREIDARLYMFALCRQLQTTCLDRRGIDCLLDADGAGRLPEAVCRMVGLMVCELVKDAGKCSQAETPRQTVTVTLRRRGATCLCTISRRGLADQCADARRGLERVERFVEELGGSCMVRPVPERGLTAIMFDVLSVERRVPMAIRRHRAGEAGHCLARQAMNGSEEDTSRGWS
jgi:hypothetical protein